jgi:tetratricopeptide (TPR) repeat protein
MTQEFETPDTDQEPPITSDDFAPAVEALPAALRAFNLAIEIYPDAASNYLARGDYFRHEREFALAAADYQHALELVNRELEQNSWGFVAQAVRDQVLIRLDEMGLPHEQAS